MLKILVVDDESSIRDALARTFSTIGYKTLTASTGRECLDLIKREEITAIFLDVILPDIDGLDVLKQIKNINKNIIVTMVSAKQDSETISKALRLGADEFVTKPFNREYLREIIAKNVHRVGLIGNNIKKPRILICDDDEEIHISIKKYLFKQFVADIDIAVDASEALTLAKEYEYDIVLMDIQLPGLSGLDAVKEIKKLNPNCSALVISGWHGAEIAAKVIEAGAIDLLNKPLEPAVLKARVSSILASKNKLMPKQI